GCPGRRGGPASRPGHAHGEGGAPCGRGAAAGAEAPGGPRGPGARRGHARDDPRGRLHRGRRPRARGRGGRGVRTDAAAAAPGLGPAPRATSAEAVRLNLRATLGRMYVRVVGSVREPSWIVSDSVLPTLGMCAYVLVYRGLGAPRSYEALAVLGGILSTYWINVLWSMGAQLYWEKQQGQLQLYLAAPCSMMSILTGMALGGILMTSVRAVLAVAVGFGVFQIHLQPFSPAQLALVFVATLAALYTLGMTLA